MPFQGPECRGEPKYARARYCEDVVQALLNNYQFKLANAATYPEAKPDGRTALHVACWTGTPNLNDWRLRAVRLLLQEGN